MTKADSNQKALNWWLIALQACTSVYLLARGYLTWRWDSPIRGLVWNEDWWASFVERGGEQSWSEFASHSDAGITFWLSVAGITLMLLGVVPWLVTHKRFERLVWLMIPATLIVLVDGFARWVNRDYELAMGIEHFLQMGTPILLLVAILRPDSLALWQKVASVLVALTFVGHGLYAMGFHAVPLNFKLMTQGILGVSEDGAVIFLAVAGWLDFIAAAGIFFKVARVPSLIYMVAWGGLTALARVVSHFDLNAKLWGLDPWLIETLVRVPHAMIPLLLLTSVWSCCQKQGKQSSE